MKIYIAVTILLVYLGVSRGEPCQGADTSSCSHMMCTDGYSPSCVDNTCTCMVSLCGVHQEDCMTRPEHCIEYAYTHGCGCDHDWHCIDGHCVCGYPAQK